MSKVLMHHGVKDQKWGVRRYQNSDGTRTTLGKAQTRKSYSPKDSVFISGMPFDDRLDSAMSLNVQRMNEQGTPVLTYDYERGVWHSDILCHHGVKGQKWGIRTKMDH